MTILPLDPTANPTPAALEDFLVQVQAAARQRGRAQLASISVEVEALDPLAVLESIFEPGERHFYVERPAEGLAVAGAEAVLAFEAKGPDRFGAVQRFIDDTLANTIAVGDLGASLTGPHFFAAFSFFAETEPGEAFAAASVFVPRWQVSQRAGRTVAVANLLIEAGSDLRALAARVWRAHGKFRAFDYSTPEFPVAAAAPVVAAKLRDVGPDGFYQRSVARALEEIASGKFQKIVLARAKDLTAAAPLHPLRVLNGLRQRFGDCYSFSVANGRGQSFIGASPERILRVEAQVLTTEALAGSAPRGATASEDAAVGGALLRSEKDLREHRAVLGSIVRRLGELGLAAEYPERSVLRRFANVQHLHTPVQARLPEGVQVGEVLSRLYPTPAVGGTPRAAAVARIREHEAFPRGLYAGAIGWIDGRGDGEFFIGLRSALVEGATARLYAGAGIVAGSSPEQEFAEAEWKFRAMQEALLAP